MTTEQILVRDWMIKAQQPVATYPQILSHSLAFARLNFLEEEVRELKLAIYKNDLVGIADALTDIDYINKGNFVTFGMDDSPFFEEVHRSNMTKLVKDGNGNYTVTKNHLGKILKPATYEPPNLQPILDMQIAAVKLPE